MMTVEIVLTMITVVTDVETVVIGDTDSDAGGDSVDSDNGGD